MHTRLFSIATGIAAGQFGVVRLQQLTTAGIGATTVRRWVRAGLLHRVHPGVYAVGHATLTREARWLAGQLACAPAGRVTHWTAAMLLNLASPFDHRPHITVPPGRGARREGIRVHRSEIPERDVLDVGPWKTTSWARAILDCADIAGRLQVEELLTAAHDVEVYDQHALDAVVAGAGGRRGLERLIPAMKALGERPRIYRSRAERRIDAQLVALGLPRPEVNAAVPRGNGRYVELDLYWRDAGINVELDGPHHDRPSQKARDADRDAWLATRLVTVLRYPVRTARAEQIARDVLALLTARGAA